MSAFLPDEGGYLCAFCAKTTKTNTAMQKQTIQKHYPEYRHHTNRMLPHLIIYTPSPSIFFISTDRAR
ncbi:hypothetical protein M406DRAFT_59091 [Cryphonectria parasitica EP155]|uniref:Uncharacterized protein n=1 Tax=Cryphonectria parasitica (strain ATCC 38755 / EP155) TaxID=660469 RepID=A0A9P4YC40_CRYP1|nr:uncharacterized protein M406DRAFT_59091 [Cryphonectria parasitica EP155]KAF3769935.1 hypothetical protein M406DRAFT_59091 [Cryphonectria parasitica EP155]